MNLIALSRAFLILHGVICGAFAIWCTVAPDSTAAAIGLAFASPAGRSEYLTIYGGIQAGLALLFCISGATRSFVRSGLLASACILGPVAAMRVATLVTISGLPTMTFVLAGLEVTLALVSIALFLMVRGR